MPTSRVMLTVSLRNLRAHKLRLVLTVLSIVLGTSFVAGSVVFTSSISTAFNSIFDSALPGVAVEVTPESRSSDGIPTAVADQLRSRAAELGIDRLTVDQQGSVTIARADGTAHQTGGAPSIGTSYIPADQALAPLDILPGGRPPAGPTEILLNSTAADAAGLHVGSRTKVVVGQGNSGPLEVTVVGLFELPSVSGGYTNVQFDPQTAAGLFSDGAHVKVIDMSARSGVSPEELARRVSAALPADAYQVQTGDEARAEQKDQVNEFLTIFTGILLAFAAIGLVVGTFIIYNTFSMIVAQRNRELALLRAIGASRPQVSRSVLFEAFVVGVLGGAVGLAVGVGLAAGLKAIVSSTSGLPDGPLEVGPSAIVASVFVGVIVTMVSAWVPAVRASRTSPIDAMRAGVTEGAAPLRNRTIAGVVALVLAIAAIGWGAWGEGLLRAVVVGIGAGAAILAAVLAGPALSRPIVDGLGRALGAPFGTVGRLARTNAVRNPRRTAATAFALTLGLMLVAVIGTLGSSFKGTVDSAVDDSVTADYIVAGANGLSLPAAVSAVVAGTPGVGQAVSLGAVRADIDGETRGGIAVYGGALSSVVTMGMHDGAPKEVPADGMLISARTAAERGWQRGQVLTFTKPGGQALPVRIAGVYDDNEALQPWLVGSSVYDAVIPETYRTTVAIFVRAAPGVDVATLRTNLEKATRDYLTVQVQDRDQFKSGVSDQIDQMLAVLYAMLGLALLIAILGIVNTLALSVVERKREIGMLRAIGTLRGQIRRTIYLESVLIAIYGAVLGVVGGAVIGWALVRTLARWGLGDPVLPWGLMALTLLAAAAVGVLAALWPAVRAARTRPLEAIAEG
ncbi:MAG: ABC transporter permease [Gordonia sp. (in: high G+C Gram-positive bacteria)]